MNKQNTMTPGAQNQKRLINVKSLETFPEITPNIFIHVPKTAGLSIKFMYGINVPLKCVVHHASRKQIEEVAGKEFMERMLIFACCRNPYSRFVSAFSFCQSPDLVHNYKGMGFDTENINTFIDKHLDEAAVETILFFKPQYTFVANSEETVELDYLMRFEELDEDWEVISDAIYGNPTPLRRHHHNSDSAQRHTLSPKSKKKLYKLYKKDFELFEYKK